MGPGSPRDRSWRERTRRWARTADRLPRNRTTPLGSVSLGVDGERESLQVAGRKLITGEHALDGPPFAVEGVAREDGGGLGGAGGARRRLGRRGRDHQQNHNEAQIAGVHGLRPFLDYVVGREPGDAVLCPFLPPHGGANRICGLRVDNSRRCGKTGLGRRGEMRSELRELALARPRRSTIFTGFRWRDLASVAQLAEQLICNQQVVGSSPSAGSR